MKLTFKKGYIIKEADGSVYWHQNRPTKHPVNGVWIDSKRGVWYPINGVNFPDLSTDICYALSEDGTLTPVVEYQEGKLYVSEGYMYKCLGTVSDGRYVFEGVTNGLFYSAGDFSELTPVSDEKDNKPSLGGFCIGDRVRVKDTVTSPTYGWGSVKHGDIGIVTKISDKLHVTFPKQADWWATPPQMEKAND